MEEEPLIAKWDEFATQPNVVVVPFFIADGLHSYEDIPVLLGIASGVARRGERGRARASSPATRTACAAARSTTRAPSARSRCSPT